MADDGAFTINIQCGQANSYDGRLGLRVSSIFVIGFGSLLGVLLPIFLARSQGLRVPKLTFFIAKYFGSGVIIATAFIHLLAPATQALQNSCLSGAITDYSWAEGIALMTIFVLFFVELMASRFEITKGHDHGDSSSASSDEVQKRSSGSQSLDVEAALVPVDHSPDLISNQNDIRDSAQPEGDNVEGVSRSELHSSHSRSNHDRINAYRPSSHLPVRDGDVSYPPGGEDHLGHQRSHNDDSDSFAAEMVALAILEVGVVFHSVFIGLTLAVAGDEFNVLYIVLVFHQTFEGLGLGSRLATAEFLKRRRSVPYILGLVYGVATPAGIAAGLVYREAFSPDAVSTIIVNGIFDSISAGILIYTGLVELMAHEFMFNQEMRKSSIWVVLSAFGCMVFGAGLMALLGAWA